MKTFTKKNHYGELFDNHMDKSPLSGKASSSRFLDIQGIYWNMITILHKCWLYVLIHFGAANYLVTPADSHDRSVCGLARCVRISRSVFDNNTHFLRMTFDKKKSHLHIDRQTDTQIWLLRNVTCDFLIYIYIYIYVYVCMYIYNKYIYIYISVMWLINDCL